MARITIEDCLDNVENMYELVHLATKRSRQLYRGSGPMVRCKNKAIVTSLREIAAGKVLKIDRRGLPDTSGEELNQIAN